MGRMGETAAWQPVFEEVDDFDRVRSPWQPRALLLMILFCGPILAGLALARNERSLGWPAVPWRWLLPFLGLGVLQAAWLIHLWNSGASGEAGDFVRIGVRSVGVLYAWFASRRQRRRFDMFERFGGARRAILGLALAAWVLEGAFETWILPILAESWREHFG